MFFNFFWYFFAIFLVIFCPRSGKNSIWNEIFFHSLLAYLSSVWIEILPEWCFLIFWIFLLFFWNFLVRVGLEWNSGQNLFSLLPGQSQPGSNRNNSKMKFFNFLKILAIFLRIFLPWSGRNKIRDEIFCYFFENFLAWVKYEQNLGRNFFFSLSRPISARFG